MAALPDKSYRNRLVHNSHRQREVFSEEDVAKAVDYLTNPARVGLWKFEAQWNSKQGISSYISEMAQKKAREEGKGRAKVTKDMLASRVRRGLLYSEDVGFLFVLFRCMILRANGGSVDDFTTLYRYDSIIRFLDLDALAAHYKEALDYFEENIYHENFTSRPGRQLMKVQKGVLIIAKGLAFEQEYYSEAELEESSPTKSIEVIALRPEPLNDVQVFLEKVGKISQPKTYTVFSPEEELLAPYVEVTRAMLPNITMSDGISRHFVKMVADYDNENYTGCVSTAGLVVEEYLTQIYETLSRSPVPPNMMIGELKGLIGDLAKQTLAPTKKKEPVSRKDIVKAVKEIDVEMDMPTALGVGSHHVLKYCDDRFLDFENQLKSLRGSEKDYNLFPAVLQLSLENIKTYRNVVSHKSTYPIDSLESLKSVYGSLSLLIWWNEQKKKIDGSKSKKEVLEQLIESSKQYGQTDI